MEWDEALARIRDTAAFCATADLERVWIEEDDFAVEIRRSRRVVKPASQPAESATVPGPADGHSPSGNGTPRASNATMLRAEFVGIVRLARPTVVEGTVLGDERELAYVESLGIRNPIRSAPGRVCAVYVTDGQVVDYGAPLFAIEPLGEHA